MICVQFTDFLLYKLENLMKKCVSFKRRDHGLCYTYKTIGLILLHINNKL